MAPWMETMTTCGPISGCLILTHTLAQELQGDLDLKLRRSSKSAVSARVHARARARFAAFIGAVPNVEPARRQNMGEMDRKTVALSAT